MESLIAQAFITSIVSAAMLMLIASGLSLVFGILDIVNFAHGEFYMLGGFVAWTFFASPAMLPIGNDIIRYLAAVVLAMIAVAGLGILAERFVFRPFRGAFGAGIIVAIGLVLILQGSALAVFGAKQKTIASPFTSTIHIGDVMISGERFAAVLGAVIIMLGIYLFIQKTMHGKAMRAVAQNTIGAQLQGIKVNQIFPLGMGIGSALAGAAGALIAPLFYINPYMGQLPIMKAFVVVILGGLGSIPGAVLGSLIIAFTETFTSIFVGGHAAMIAIMLIVIAILLLRPEGLFGHAEEK